MSTESLERTVSRTTPGRIRRRQILLGVGVSCVLGVGAWISGSSTGVSCEYQGGETTRAMPGDTLIGLARGAVDGFGVTLPEGEVVQDIVQHNGLLNATIYAGQTVELPTNCQ